MSLISILSVLPQRKRQEAIEEKLNDARLVEKLSKREQLQTEADAMLEKQARYDKFFSSCYESSDSALLTAHDVMKRGASGVLSAAR